MKVTLHTKKAPKDIVRIQYQKNITAPLFKESNGVKELVFSEPKQKELNLRKLQTLVRTWVRTSQRHRINALCIHTDLIHSKMLEEYGEERVYSFIAENIILAAYDFKTYKTDKEKTSLAVYFEGSLTAKIKAALKKGEIVGHYTNIARDISNTPGGDMTPETLARDAKKAATGTKASVKVLNKAAIEKLGMGALLGVARGSRIGPRFIVMEYWGAGKTNKKEKPIVYVGKGITFDTGGLSLKPGDSMLDMHLDMSGGASVIAAVACIAKLGLKKNVVGLIPAAENAVSDESMRPGDILKSMSGKTIDVLNTDAEGRLILADGLTYAERYNPRLVVDVATLTGAALIALGTHASAIMSPDEKISEKIKNIGEKSGEYVWPLPLWEEYRQYVKGRFADVANIPAAGNSRYAGVINAGMFLYCFAEKYPWAHIDMAPRMTANSSDHLGKGSTGEPTRLLVAVAETY